MKIRILKGSKLQQYAPRIHEFYRSRIPQIKNIECIRMCALCGIVENDFGTVIGAARVFTDLCAYAFVTDLYIDEKFRFKGYGTSLISALCNSCRKYGLETVYFLDAAQNSAADQFMKKCNFSNSDTDLYIRKFY